MDAIYKFQPDSRYIQTAVTRYREQQPFLYRPVGQFATLILVLLAAALYAHQIAAPWQPVINGVLLLVVLLTPFSVLFISRLIHRRLQSRANPNATIIVTLSDSGIHGDGPAATTQLAWQAYSRAVRYSDGIMLLRRGSIRWLPDAALHESTPESATKLVSAKLPARSVA